MKNTNRILLSNLAVIGIVVLSAFVIGRTVYQIITF